MRVDFISFFIHLGWGKTGFSCFFQFQSLTVFIATLSYIHPYIYISTHPKKSWNVYIPHCNFMLLLTFSPDLAIKFLTLNC